MLLWSCHSSWYLSINGSWKINRETLNILLDFKLKYCSLLVSARKRNKETLDRCYWCDNLEPNIFLQATVCCLICGNTVYSCINFSVVTIRRTAVSPSPVGKTWNSHFTHFNENESLSIFLFKCVTYSIPFCIHVKYNTLNFLSNEFSRCSKLFNETKLKNITQHITIQYSVLSEAKNVPVFTASDKFFNYLLRMAPGVQHAKEI